MKKLTKLSDEQKSQLKPWAEKWRSIGLTTGPMSDDEKLKVSAALIEMYEFAGKKKPRVFFVKSPLVGRFVAGFAAAIWHLRKNKKSSEVGSAVRSAVRSAVDSEVGSAVDSEVGSAVRSAVGSAVGLKDKALSFNFDFRAMVKLSADLKLGKFGIECSGSAYRMVRGGNMWPGWAAFLSFFKDKINLSEINQKKLSAFEVTSSLCGYHWFHEEFVVVSDRPVFIKTDDRGRSHSLDGPFIEWADGTSLYQVHGQKCARYVCDTPKDKFTKDMILSETNVDYRRFMIEKIGIERAVKLLGAEVVDTYESKVGGKYELLLVDYDGRGNKRPYLKMVNPSTEGMFHIEGIAPGATTVKQALMFRNKTKVFCEPEMLS